MAYKLLREGVNGVLRLADNAFICNDPKNVDWKEYQRWLSLGNSPEPADPPPAPIDFSDVDNVEKALKAIALVFAEKTGMTVQQLKIAFKQKWDSLP